MIIDMHTHIGTALDFDIPGEMLLEAMDKYQIDYALVSNSECVEGDHNGRIIPKEQQISQMEANQRMIAFARQHPDRLGVLLWGKPYTESCTKEFEMLLKENRDIVFGIKIHPFHSMIRFSSRKVQAYIRLAEKYKIPVLTHTAPDLHCGAIQVYQMAVKYPKVNFIMGHMELGTNNQQAARYIAKQPNLYGDTAWVYPKNAIRMLKLCGPDKLLFGTDAPIDGVDTYGHPEFYQIYLKRLRYMVGKDVYEKVMYKNAMRLFGLEKLFVRGERKITA